MPDKAVQVVMWSYFPIVFRWADVPTQSNPIIWGGWGGGLIKLKGILKKLIKASIFL